MANEWSELPEGLNGPARELVREMRAAKDAAGLSLAGLGALTHYSRSSWERWLNGKRLVTSGALAGFARAAGADGAYLARLLVYASLEGGEAAAADPPRAPRPATSPAPPIAQLPASVGDFTGRCAQIETMLNALINGTGEQPDRTPVVIVSGGGGVGKTTLAVYVGHRLAGRFPDGTLYADLRGTDRDPRDPADVLAGWLRELGDEPARPPEGLEERAARFRSLLRERALLVLLDNARDAAQIRPLLPGVSRGAVIVTSRSRLRHLPANCRVELEPMTYPEALTLLEKVAGAGRVRREPQAAAAVLDACAGLPLALRICAARLETRPTWSVQTLAERIAREHRRIDELAVGELAVRSSLDMSYRQLAEQDDAARAFRLLGLATIPDIGLAPAAALLGMDPDRAERALEALVNMYLLESPAPRLYRFHDLLRIYAAEKAGLEPEPEQLKALRRLGGWYLYASFQAVSALDVARPPVLPAEPMHREPEVRFADSAQALTWLDAERNNLAALARLADRRGLSAIAIHLPAATAHYHHLRGRWAQLAELSEIALRNAGRTGDQGGEAKALGALGWSRYHTHDYGEALALLGRALSIYEELDDPMGASSTLDRMSSVSNAAGYRDAALAYQESAVERLRATGDQQILLTATTNLALTYAQLGKADSFFELCREILPVARRAGLGFAVAPLLEASGEMHLEAGRVPEAIAALAESVEVFETVGNRPALADAQEHLGEAHLAAGDPGRALACWHRALEIFEHCDVRRAEAVRTRIGKSGPDADAR